MADGLIRRYNVPVNKIDSKHLRFVVRALHEVGVHWNGMGHQLRIDNLDKIKQDYVSVSRCLIAMVDSLLKGRFINQPGSPATWRTIVEVVHAPAGGNNPLHAKRVAGKLKEFQTFSPGSIAQKVATTSLFEQFETEEDIVRRVSALLVPVAARWFEIGALLGLPLNTLTTIKDQTLPSASDRMHRVVEEWLMHAEVLELEIPSWQVVVDVVAHGAGGDDPACAQQVAEQCKRDIPGDVHGGCRPGGASLVASAGTRNGHQSPATPATTFTVKNIGNAITTVNDWFELGRQLEMPYHILEQTRTDYFVFGTARQRNEMITLWLQMDTSASWEKLCTSLREMNQIVLAANIEEKYMTL